MSYELAREKYEETSYQKSRGRERKSDKKGIGDFPDMMRQSNLTAE